MLFTAWNIFFIETLEMVVKFWGQRFEAMWPMKYLECRTVLFILFCGNLGYHYGNITY